ncbi:MAG: TonB-dependent receptor [Chitinophagaceae bacterium]|nr:TonB-dependent receptor [Chitinophagaceae bacterium]
MLLISASVIGAFAQNRQVSGVVTSSEASGPVEGATVTVKGTTTSVVTDAQGRYRITVPAANSILVFSHTGFVSIELPTAGKTTVDASMLPQVKSLDDVVVIGYQTVRRADLTGSVSSINARDLKDIPINSAAEALAGRLAGVQIIQSEGSPDASAVIRVRGGGSITQDNSPLYVVDGMQVENALSVLAPQDIESIDVLKDASATAIYGARGANGVVIITTKGGRNRKTRINYNGLAGIRNLANKLDVMDPYEFVMYQYERSRGSQTERNDFQNVYGRWEDLDLYKYARMADWQEEMFGRNALMQTHNVSMVGGNESTTFNLSLTSNKEQGIMLGSDFDRKLVNFKFDHKVNKKLKVGMAVRYNNTVVNGAGTANEGSSATNRLRHAIKYRPILMAGQSMFDYDPDYADQTNANSLALVNPILLNQAEYRKNRTGTANISGFFQYDINKYLSFKSTLGYDVSNIRQDAFNDTITSVARQNSNMPTAQINTIARTVLTNSNVLTFTMNKSNSRFSEKNDLTVLVGQETYEATNKNYRIETRYFPVGITAKAALGNMGLGSAPVGTSQPPPVSNEGVFRLSSFFGQASYAYDKKYLLTLSMRADGASKFAEGNRWGYFPSASVAWRALQEDFMEFLTPTFSDLKLRVSYGKAGNNRIDDFQFLSLFEALTYYSVNDQLITAYRPRSLANQHLVWESTISQNIGLDMGFLRDRLAVSVDLYHNKTKDLLVNVPVPTSSGYTSQIQNVGSTSNKGVEVQINGVPIAKGDFTWRANFNISFNKNNIESLGRFQDFFLASSTWGGGNQPSDFVVRPGISVGSIWGLITDGYYAIEDFDFNNGAYTLKPNVASNQSITATTPQPGMLKFRDVNNDGVVDDKDRTVIGSTQPKFFGGLNQQFNYKNFDLSVFVNFQVGNDVYNANKLEFTSGYTPNSNLLAMMNGRWRTVDANGVVVTDPAALAKLNEGVGLWAPLRSASSFYVHSWAIEDGSFLRINNITLGYTLPANILKRVGIQSLRVYGTVNNLAVFTKYTGYDPEVNTRRNTPLTPGVDYSAYPRSRAYIVGLNLSL